MNKDTRRMLRVPEELHSKIEIFKKENNRVVRKLKL